MNKVGFAKVLSISTILSLLMSATAPLMALAAPTDSVNPVASITAPTNGATVSGVVNLTANATDSFSNCVIRVFGQSYDVSVLGATHSGGNVFTCGANQDAIYSAQHGTNVSRIAPYLIPSTYIGIAKVDFYIDGVLTSTDISAPYSYNWNSATVSNGSHTLQVKAYDGRNTGNSAIISITVNNSTGTPPVPTPTTTPGPSTNTSTQGSTTTSQYNRYKKYKVNKELREISKKLNKILRKEKNAEMRDLITRLINLINTNTQDVEGDQDDD